MDKPRLSFWQIWNMSFGFLVELGGASGAPPRPPARCAGVNPAPLAALAFLPCSMLTMAIS